MSTLAVGILPCSTRQPLLQECCIIGDEIYFFFGSCLKIYSWKIPQFCAALLGHINNKNENFITDCAVWHNFPVLGGSAWGCKAAISCVLASRNWEPGCPPRWTLLGYCRVCKCGRLAAAELMVLVPGLEGAGNLNENGEPQGVMGSQMCVAFVPLLTPYYPGK